MRGAATLRYGSQAIGGVVNSINNRVPMTLPEAASANVNASYGTNGDVAQAAGELDAGAGQFAFHADAFGRHADDYDVPGGTQANSFVHGYGYSGGSSYFFGDDNASHTGLSVIHYDAEYGIPSDTTFIDMRQTKLLSKSSIALGDGTWKALNVDVGYADYVHDEKDPDNTVEATFRNKEWDGRAEVTLGPTGPLSASALGVQFGDRDFSAEGDASTYLLPTQTHSVAAFAFTEAPLGQRTQLQAAGRVEQLAEALDAYRGALLVVSHDFGFLERIRVSTVIEIDRGGHLYLRGDLTR